MGTCCSSSKENADSAAQPNLNVHKPKPKQSAEIVEKQKEQVSNQVNIQCDDPAFKLNLKVDDSTTFEKLYELVAEKYEVITPHTYSIHYNLIEIMNLQATLKEQHIDEKTELFLVKKDDVRMPLYDAEAARPIKLYTSNDLTQKDSDYGSYLFNWNANQDSDFIDMDENEGKHEINNIQVNQARRDRPVAAKLWQTAVQNRPNFEYKRNEDMSYLNITGNTVDMNPPRNTHTPGNFNYQALNQTNAQESDESMVTDEFRILERQYDHPVPHPSGFFSDLQGPFSSINRIN